MSLSSRREEGREAGRLGPIGQDQSSADYLPLRRLRALDLAQKTREREKGQAPPPGACPNNPSTCARRWRKVLQHAEEFPLGSELNSAESFARPNSGREPGPERCPEPQSDVTAITLLPADGGPDLPASRGSGLEWYGSIRRACLPFRGGAIRGSPRDVVPGCRSAPAPELIVTKITEFAFLLISPEMAPRNLCFTKKGLYSGPSGNGGARSLA